MTLLQRLRRWLHEPLVQFLLGGLLVFGWSSWRGERADPASKTITVTEGQAQQLVANFVQTWQRAPSPQELDGLIRDYVKEEIYYREAKRMGLDLDDPIVRRRMRSKMEFLSQAELENERPSDATLQAWLDHHPDRYAASVHYDFDQIYLDALQEGDASVRTKSILGQIAKGADWQALGDRISLPHSLENADRETIAHTFGDEFAKALAAVQPGSWAGPVVSGFGLHLVRIRAARSSGKPQLADVRQQVENDWRAATATEREAKAYAAIADRYTVRIAKP